MKLEDLQAAIDKIAVDIETNPKGGASDEAMQGVVLVLGSVAINHHRIADALDLIAKHLAPAVAMREETPEERDQREGWIQWDAVGPAPIFSRDSMVQVRLRGDVPGEEYPAEPAAQAQTLIWGHSNGDGDIIAYRVVA